VTLEIRHDAAGMHGEGPHAVFGAELVELHREEAVGRFGLAVREPCRNPL